MKIKDIENELEKRKKFKTIKQKEPEPSKKQVTMRPVYQELSSGPSGE